MYANEVYSCLVCGFVTKTLSLKCFQLHTKNGILVKLIWSTNGEDNNRLLTWNRIRKSFGKFIDQCIFNMSPSNAMSPWKKGHCVNRVIINRVNSISSTKLKDKSQRSSPLDQARFLAISRIQHCFVNDYTEALVALDIFNYLWRRLLATAPVTWSQNYTGFEIKLLMALFGEQLLQSG